MNISIDEIRILIGLARRGLLYLADPDKWPNRDLDGEAMIELEDCANRLEEVNDTLRKYAPDVDQLVE